MESNGRTNIGFRVESGLDNWRPTTQKETHQL